MFGLHLTPTLSERPCVPIFLNNFLVNILQLARFQMSQTSTSGIEF